MFSGSMYEPRRTFQTIQGGYLSKTGYRGTAAHTSNYRTNGTGRDTYINRDNGGFNKMFEPCKYAEGGTMGYKNKFVERAPIIHAKNLYYHSDGTGRDSYIVETSGGFNNLT